MKGLQNTINELRYDQDEGGRKLKGKYLQAILAESLCQRKHDEEAGRNGQKVKAYANHLEEVDEHRMYARLWRSRQNQQPHIGEWFGILPLS